MGPKSSPLYIDYDVDKKTTTPQYIHNDVGPKDAPPYIDYGNGNSDDDDEEKDKEPSENTEESEEERKKKWKSITTIGRSGDKECHNSSLLWRLIM